MAVPSSIFSSERSMPASSFPWAVLLAICLVLGVEVWLHIIPTRSLLNYSRGLGTYYEVKHTVDTLGAADVSAVGSSRGRESLVVPLLSEIINGDQPGTYSVANYSCPGSTTEDIQRIVKHLLESSNPPRILLYFLSPRVLHGTASSMQRAEVFGVFPDKYGERSGGWLVALSEEPVWRFRNLLGEHLLLFRHRYHFRNLITSAVRRRDPTQPIQGGYTAWQRYVPNRSLVNRPISDRQIRNYVNQLLDENGRYTMSESRIEALRGTLELARDHGVRTILVETPISPDLERHFPSGISERFMGIMESIQAEFDVEFHTTADLGVEISRENFREQSHLNLSGARILTRAVAEQLVLPHLAQSRN